MLFVRSLVEEVTAADLAAGLMVALLTCGFWMCCARAASLTCGSWIGCAMAVFTLVADVIGVNADVDDTANTWN